MRSPTCLAVEYRPVPGWPLRVSAAGEVLGPKGVRRPTPDKDGYAFITARRPGRPWPSQLRVHTAVLLAWVGPPPPGAEGRHLNGRKDDNRVENLAWSSHQENIGDKYAHGTMPLGEAVPGAKLTADQVREIRRLRPTTTLAQLAERYGVDQTTVSRVARGLDWRHVR